VEVVQFEPPADAFVPLHVRAIDKRLRPYQ
jgi:hypothetical protein